MNKPRRRKKLLEFDPLDSKYAASDANNTNSSGLSCNVIAGKGRRRREASGSGGRVNGLKHRPRISWQQILLLASLLLACQWRATSSHLVSEDEDSVIISGQQGQLFRGRKLAAHDQLGGQSKQVAAFLGLRYASAPIKRLRFMPPTPFNYGPTKQVPGGEQRAHDLRHFGPICMQRLPMEPDRDQIWPPATGANNDDANWRSRRWQIQSSLMDRLLAPQVSSTWRPLVRQLASARFVQSEDCLNLNIYTPIGALRRSGQRQESANITQAAGLPVLVLIHGHSFDFGSGSTLDGRRFARDQSSLVITLNYRLHILGFPGKVGPASSRTNLGFLDQVAALHWIQANVRSFGGSPNRITLLGAKGGALFVHLLMVSPLARGLFQRAVLEDGTALSPVVANSMLAAAGGGQSRQLVVGSHQQQQQQLAARLIGQLNDCPLGQSDEEHPTWTPLVECLRTRPAASLVRNLPLEFIDTSRSPSVNSIPIATKWIQPIEQVLDLLIKEELKARLDQEERNKSTTSDEQQRDSRRQHLEELKRLLVTASSAEQSIGVSLESRQLDRLTALMIHRFLQEPAGTTNLLSNDESHRLRSLLEEILGAIYLPSNETLPVGPLFVPHLDSGLILADQSNLGVSGVELASSMLQPNSPFAQRDLLLGLTHTLIDFNTSEDREILALSTGLYVAPGLSSRRLLEQGLTEEEAINQVNLFVQSFYRHHQQEISNSIISQYLSRKGNMLQSPATNAAQASNQNHGTQQRQKQLFLAEAMRKLYQHSLIDIPVIKTALIHSMHQLETLAELFVSQQVVKLNEAQQSENRDHEELEQLINESKLDEEFHQFVRGFYRNSDRWPIRLVPISSGPIRSEEANRERQSHSTFLFQMGTNFDWLKSKLEIAIERNQSNLILKTILSKLLEEFGKINQDEPFGCSFEDLFRDDDFDDGELNPNSDGSLLKKFRLWICGRRLEKRLANFVETGNVNRGSKTQKELKSTSLSVFEHECAGFLQESKQNQRQDNLEDHHLVQLIQTKAGRRTGADFEILVERGAQTASSDLHCSRLLERLAFEELVEGDDRPESPLTDWGIFNVFGQRLASLFSAGGDANWLQDSFLNSTTNQLERERFDSKVTFWANFVSALNCSRTQPIGAGSLSLFAQANSTLLNMNLNLNCQHQFGGAATQQTANSLIQSIVGRIKLELSQQVATSRRHRGQAKGQLAVANLSSSQNHHSLRMANMSSGQHEQQQQQQQQQGGRMVQFEDGAAELVTEAMPSGSDFFASWLAADKKWPTGTHKLFAQHQLMWLSGVGLALASIFALGVSVLVVSRQKKRRENDSEHDTTGKGLGTHWNTSTESNLQLDAGRLEEEHSNKFDGPTDGQDGASLHCVDLVYSKQPYDSNHLQESPQDQSPSHLELFVSPAAFVEGQHTHLVQFDRGNFSPARMNAASEQPQQHLPTCNLILMGQNQQPLLSSSSETTSTTNNTSNQRAPSSVSLVSSITPTNEGQPRRTQKKRVQISDPKRDADTSPFRSSRQQLGADESAASQLQLTKLYGREQLACPIHRSSSNLNLMLQPNSANLSNGTNSLMRLHDQHTHSHRHQQQQQQRALALHDNIQNQQQVCAVHKFYHRPESNLSDFYASHQR